METNHDIHKDEIIFYNSIKTFFEVGLELASKLNLELLIDKFKTYKKEKEKK
jgi:hypothetical protein